LINLDNLVDAFTTYKNARPFDHCVVDDFLPAELARQVDAEFLDYDSDKWFSYTNAIEIKKQCKDWGLFPKYTYRLFNYLNSPEFVTILSKQVGVQLYSDPGLHGGGWHSHSVGGRLNPHLDYSIHPKLGLQRKLNIIVYVSKDLQAEHGGNLGLWTGDEHGPGDLVKEVAPIFNRAVIFDTTQNSWHGMSRGLTQPEGIYRKSLAIYYLADPVEPVDPRARALFAPTPEQQNDPSVLDLIASRAK
jgi:Rps23 Pro-64 3,4-dihydroxylase Tpa1-like proline 4-hydroxylase